MKHFFLCLASIIMPLIATAQRFSSRYVIASARQSLESKFNKTYSNLSVVDDLGQMFVVSSTNGGTAYVDKKSNKVLGITPSIYDKGRVLPCGMQLWIEAANNAIKNGKTQEEACQSDNATDIAPFITTAWNQEKPYYNLCPKAGLKRCVTGCVATAMAQVLNYFEYPTSGHGSSTYYVTTGADNNLKTTSYTGTINGKYDWANMIDNYSNSYTDDQATAVATLMRDCGYSVHMSYSKEESGAADVYIPSALAYNFDYDSLSVNYLRHDYCTEEEWFGVIYSELAAKRPILFAGQSVSGNGGHEFVIDGMSADGKVHINWGWGGIGDGYFDLSVMSSTNDFTLSQSIVYGFNPQPTPENSTISYKTKILVESPELSTSDGKLYFKGVVLNGDWREFVGDIAMIVQDVNDEDNEYGVIFLQSPKDDDDAVALPGSYGWFFEEDSLDFNSYFVDENTQEKLFFPASTYEVTFVYQGVNDDVEKTAITEGGVEWKPRFVVDSSGNITFDSSSSIVFPTTSHPSVVDDSKAYNLSGNCVSTNFNPHCHNKPFHKLNIL